MAKGPTIKFYKAKLKTGGKTIEQIKNAFDDANISDEEINLWLAAYDLIDGVEIIVMKSWTGSGYCPVSYKDKDSEKFKEFYYSVEQDPVFGAYVNEREEFLKDWEEEEYEPSGSIVFEDDDVEIIEELEGTK